MGLAVAIWYAMTTTFQPECNYYGEGPYAPCPGAHPDWVIGAVLGIVAGVATYAVLVLIAFGMHRVWDARR